MSDMSNYLKGEIIKHYFRTGTAAKPTNLYVALFTSATTDAGGGTEVTGGSYARAQLNPLDANWADQVAGDGHTSNTAEVTFPAPTADWGVVTHMAVVDASSGGNFIVHGALTASRTIENGQAAPKYNAGELDVIFA